MGRKMFPTTITSVIIVIVVAQSIGAHTPTSEISSPGSSQTQPAASEQSTQSRDSSNEGQEQAGRLFVQVNEQQKYQIVDVAQQTNADQQSTETTTVPTTTTTAPTTTTTTTATTRESIIGDCKLGNETYQVGDKWNPDLPPHGIQVCVLCECIAYLSRAKVTCRRTAKDCPQIDSCPFGEKPIAPPGQCCKVCLSHNILGEGPARPPSVPMSSGQPHWYMEGSQPASQKQPGGQQPRNASTETQNNGTLVGGSGVELPSRRASKPKLSGLRPSNKELNTKDSKLAFKSLEARNKFLSAADEQSGQMNNTNDKDSSTTATANGNEAASVCKLGNDTYTIGDSWKPNLPPFGVQVCVLCECAARLRKSCYEAKVTCRRIANECPVIESCPDGKAPMTAPGQCCKSCSTSEMLTEQPATTTSIERVGIAANVSESTLTPTPTNGTREATSDAAAATTTVKRSTTREFNFKDLPLCKRDGSDVGISKRSRGSTAAKVKKGSRTSEVTRKAKKKQKDPLNGIRGRS